MKKSPATLSHVPIMVLLLLGAVASAMALGQSAVAPANTPGPAAAVAGESCFATTLATSGQFTETLLPLPIQAAIDAAPAGGTVKVAGLCRGVNLRNGEWQIAVITKNLTLEGGYTVTNWITPSAGNVTVLDAAEAGRGLLILPPANGVTLRNFTLVNGRADSANGGGIYANAFTFLDGVTVMSSTAGSGFSGGGAYFQAQSIVINSRFTNNVAALHGGGALFRDSATIFNSIFSGNSASSSGGGAALISVSELDGVRFEQNSCNPCASFGGGGVWAKSSVTIDRSQFIANTSPSYGSGFTHGFGDATLPSDSVSIKNTLFARNTGNTAVLAGSRGTLNIQHSTFASPTGSLAAISQVTGTVNVTNVLIANHLYGLNQVAGTMRSTRLFFDGVTNPIFGAVTTEGTIGGHARFANPAGDDYRLTASSDARNQAVASQVTNDHDGEPRPLDGIADIGYDEFAPYVIHISVDGMGGAYLKPLLEAGAVPNFAKLRDGGASTMNARTDVDYSITLPNHTAMLTGRPVGNRFGAASGHLWTDNSDPLPAQTLHNQPDTGYYIASSFDVAHDHGFRTGLYASKTKFVIYTQSYTQGVGAPDVTGPNNGTRKIDRIAITENDSTSMVAQLLADLNDPARRPNYAFVHFNDPDAAGHANNWGSQAYTNAVLNVDAKLGQILGVIAASPVLSGNTTIVLSADHGGGVASSGGQNSHDVATAPLNFTIPFIVWGPNVPANHDLYTLNGLSTTFPYTAHVAFGLSGQPIRNGDGGNCALQRLGLPPIPGSWMRNLGNACARSPVVPAVILQPGSVWKYRDDGRDPGGAWRALGFDDSTWASGPAPLGYGDPVSTVINGGPADNRFVTSYFRKAFSITNPLDIASLSLLVRRDDGAVVYVNGTTVARSNMPAGPIGFRTLASATATADEGNFFAYHVPVSALVAGMNQLAVEVHQVGPASSDVIFDAALIAAAHTTLAGENVFVVPAAAVEQNPTTIQQHVFLPMVADTPCVVVATTAALGLDAFYKKLCDVSGLPVVSSAATPDRALIAAGDVIRKMLARRPDVLRTLADGPTRVGILAASEVLTDLPEYRNLYSLFPGTDWNNRARGLGATPFIPLSSNDEANTLCYSGDPWRGESIMVHEFAHTIKIMGLEVMSPTFASQVQTTFDVAIGAGKWSNTYAGTNAQEYWAEGVQSYFNTNLEAIPSDGIHNSVNTRAELQAYDPALYALIDNAFAGVTWSYRCP